MLPLLLFLSVMLYMLVLHTCHTTSHTTCTAVVIFGATGTVGRSMLDFIVSQDVMGSDVKVGGLQ